MEWMQVLAIVGSMLVAIGILGVFFLKTIDRLDRSLEEIKREHMDFNAFMRDLNRRVCSLEKKEKPKKKKKKV